MSHPLLQRGFAILFFSGTYSESAIVLVGGFGIVKFSAAQIQKYQNFLPESGLPLSP